MCGRFLWLCISWMTGAGNDTKPDADRHYQLNWTKPFTTKIYDPEWINDTK